MGWASIWQLQQRKIYRDVMQLKIPLLFQLSLLRSLCWQLCLPIYLLSPNAQKYPSKIDSIHGLWESPWSYRLASSKLLEIGTLPGTELSEQDNLPASHSWKKHMKSLKKFVSWFVNIWHSYLWSYNVKLYGKTICNYHLYISYCIFRIFWMNLLSIDHSFLLFWNKLFYRNNLHLLISCKHYYYV